MTPADLRSALDRLGLTQAALARRCQQSPVTVARWLTPAALKSARAIPSWLASWIAMYGRLTHEQRKEIWPE